MPQGIAFYEGEVGGEVGWRKGGHNLKHKEVIKGRWEGKGGRGGGHNLKHKEEVIVQQLSKFFYQTA